MGRAKSYSRDDIVRKAMNVFWRHGFDGASTQMLVAEMGVNRFSVYAEFGHKQALFEAALGLYEQEVVSRNLAGIEAEGADLDAIQLLFDGFARWAGETDSEWGCFICNTATEMAASHPISQAVVNRYVTRLSAAFAHCLQQAQAQDQLWPETDVAKEGGFLATLLLGFFVQLRAQVPPALIQASAQSVQAYLQRLTRPGRWQPKTICAD